MSNTGKFVKAEGSTSATIMIIGEAPGNTEAIKGKPFVGRSGRLLRNYLSRARIHTGDCYITNVIKEKPYKNNINPFIKAGKEITTKGKPHVERLKNEIKEVNPNVIVAVGNVPLYVLTGYTGITSRRGSIYESTLVPGQKVIPIIHPAAALRMYIYRHFIHKDLVKVKKESEFSDLRLEGLKIITDPSFYESLEYLEACKDSNLVGFDIEVRNHEVDCISFSRKPGEAISIPFVAGMHNLFNPDQELNLWKKIAEVLENPRIKKVAHNAVFDSSFLFRRYGIHIKNIEDTMIAAGILYPDFPKGLDFLTSIYTRLPYYKDDGKFRNPKVSDKDYWIYNAKDSLVLTEILPQQLEELKKMGNMETYTAQKYLISPLIYMNGRGMRMDVKKLRNKADKAEKEMTEIRKECEKHIGHEFNPNSPTQCKEYFYEELGLKPYTNKGKPTTNETAMKRLSRRGYKVAQLVLNYRHLSKAKGTYYEMPFDKDNRLRSSFNPVGTSTGRLSSSKTIFGTGGNQQNLTPDFKSCIYPDKDYILYEIDLGQAENRIVSYIAPDERMMRAFEDGTDIHKLTASMIFGKDIKDISDKHDVEKNPSLAANIGSGDKSERFWGKQGNHSFNYGLGARSFSLRYEIPIKEGKFIRDKYLNNYPGIAKMHRWIQNSLKDNRTLTNLFGRKFLFMDRWGDSLFKQAYAFIPQSTVADIINRRGLNEIYYKRDLYRPIELLNQVHDSIIFQISKEFSPRQHAECLLSLCKSLETPLIWRDKEFSIPAELTIFRDNLKEGDEIGKITSMEIKEIIDCVFNN